MEKKEMKDKEIQKKERDERAARRSLLREAVKDEEEDDSAPASKKPRLDLLDMLSSSTTSVLDILTVSGRKPLPTFSKDQIIIKETETESRPGVLDIFDALPKDALTEDKEAAVKVDENYLFSHLNFTKFKGGDGGGLHEGLHGGGGVFLFL